MKRVSKYAAAAVVTGALALAAATPSQARWYGHHGHYHAGPAAAIGFGVGALFGAAAANSYYDDGYYDYAYEPYGGYAYATPDYGYYNPHRGPGCIQSPGSINFTGCDR